MLASGVTPCQCRFLMAFQLAANARIMDLVPTGLWTGLCAVPLRPQGRPPATQAQPRQLERQCRGQMHLHCREGGVPQEGKAPSSAAWETHGGLNVSGLQAATIPPPQNRMQRGRCIA